jgi:hypothetical protein
MLKIEFILLYIIKTMSIIYLINSIRYAYYKNIELSTQNHTIANELQSLNESNDNKYNLDKFKTYIYLKKYRFSKSTEITTCDGVGKCKVFRFVDR